MDEIVIDAQNLSKVFYHFDSRLPFIKRFLRPHQIMVQAVQDVSFTIKKGSIVGFIGSNGAGKSTMIKMLTGTLYPSSGKLEVNGEIPFERSINFRKNISVVVGNKLQLFQDVSAMDYFQLIGTLYEVEPSILQERILELSNLLDVTDQLYQQVRTLSLGQKMKMEFIAASITSPEILFLDEPTIGLDIQAKKDIREFLRKMNEEWQTTIILTSHDMDDISSVCDEVIVIDKGKILLQESMDIILSKF
ncbi:ABC transporter ATP-binding protein, partial [Streptococcus sp. 19428wC2_LYSM12]